MIPHALRLFFVIHFFADIIFAIPLLLAPVGFLKLLGWESVDPVSTRLVGAALVGIGVESLLGRNGSRDSFATMLRLKILWSATATTGLVISALQGAPLMTWFFVLVFGSFCGVWTYFRWRLARGG